MNFKTIGIPTIKLLVIAAVITTLLFLTNNTNRSEDCTKSGRCECCFP